MIYNLNVREEFFGSTIFDLEKGKRYYLNKIETDKLLLENILPKDVVIKNHDKIKLTRINSSEININHFSFADIIYLEVTRECNLRCKHCLNSSGNKLKDELSKKDMEKFINTMSEFGIQEIRFTGGEPLLFKYIYDLMELATNKGIYVSMGTNGTLITKEIAKKLKKVGLKKAIISIDGTEKKNDAIRGKGSYMKAMAGLENLKNENIQVRVNSVILKENIEDVISLAKELNKKKINIFIRRFIESGRGIDFKNNMLTEEDYKYVKSMLSNELDNFNYVNGHYLKNDDEAIISRIKLPFSIENGCKAGQRALVITPEGNIHLCGFLAAQGFGEVGNIKDIKEWKVFWNLIHKNEQLNDLKLKLNDYNKIPKIKKTNCLAYVQRLYYSENK